MSLMVSPVVAIERGRRSTIESVIDHIENLPFKDFGLKHMRCVGVDVEIGAQKVRDPLHLPHANEHRGDKPFVCIEV